MRGKKNTLNAGWPDNPVVDEVRAIRAEIWREAGSTPEGLIRLLQASRKARAKKPRAKRNNRCARSD